MSKLFKLSDDGFEFFLLFNIDILKQSECENLGFKIKQLPSPKQEFRCTEIFPSIRFQLV